MQAELTEANKEAHIFKDDDDNRLQKLFKKYQETHALITEIFAASTHNFGYNYLFSDALIRKKRNIFFIIFVLFSEKVIEGIARVYTAKGSEMRKQVKCGLLFLAHLGGRLKEQ